MRRDPLRRATVSVLFGAVLPLALFGGMAMQAESHVPHADAAVFYTLLPALLFCMMAFAIWILTRQKPAGSAPISNVRR